MNGRDRRRLRAGVRSEGKTARNRKRYRRPAQTAQAEEFLEHIKRFTPEWAAGITGLPAEDIETAEPRRLANLILSGESSDNAW